MADPEAAAPPADVGGPLGDPAALREAYRRMVVVRRFEQQASDLYRDSLIPGFLHLSIGQEATAVGACWPLRRDDVITSNHRGHGHCLAKGLEPGPMFAELMGRETGTCRGRGGSMHIADPAYGVFGANGIVGAGLPIAVGAATASRIRGDDRVVVAFFGDGAVSQGYFHEAVNLAALWHLPVLFLCENNHYSEFSPEDLVQPVAPAARAAGYGVEARTVDGTDVVAVAALVAGLVDRARRGAGPFLVEADTERWQGHYEGDPERYRDPAERDRHAARADSLGGPGFLSAAKAKDRLVRRRIAGVGTGDETRDEVSNEPHPYEGFMGRVADVIVRGATVEQAARSSPDLVPMEASPAHSTSPPPDLVASRLSLSTCRSLGEVTDTWTTMRARAEQAVSEANAVVRSLDTSPLVELEDEPAVPGLAFTVRCGASSARLAMRRTGREAWLEVSGAPVAGGADAPVQPDDVDVMEDLIVALLAEQIRGDPR